MTQCDGCGLEAEAGALTVQWLDDELVTFHHSTATSSVCRRRAFGKTRTARARQRAPRRPNRVRPDLLWQPQVDFDEQAARERPPGDG